MRKVVGAILSSLFLCLLPGCSIEPIRAVIVESRRLEGRPGITLLDPNDELYSATIAGGGSSWWGEMSGGIKGGNNCRVSYDPSYSKNLWMVVEGKLSNGRKYPVVLDTGASVGLCVNDIHVLENKLAVYPFKNDGESNGWGVCNLPEVGIGEILLSKWPCIYRDQHTEIQLFGLPISRDKAIVAGLQSLRKFKYIKFDSIRKEAELSPKKTFEPVQPDYWSKYSLTIEEDLNGNAFLFVKIPIDGKETELQIDTGSGRGLSIREELWEEMREKVNGIKLREDKELYPYIGMLECKRGIIPRLEIGDRIVENAAISVFPNDSELLEESQGLLGMKYFQNTVIVLDFERNLMWVEKNNKADSKELPAFSKR